MRLDPVILFAVTLTAAVVWLVSWRLVGIYLSDDGDLAGSIQSGRSILLSDWTRLQGEEVNGYLDSINVFHSHFYEAVAEALPLSRKVIVVRYVPDAFGKPLRGRIKGRSIKWWPKPDLLGTQLSADRFLVWHRRRRPAHAPVKRPS